MDVKVGSMFKDPQNLLFQIKKRKKDICIWGILISIVILVFFLISSKDFSFMLVLSSLTQMFAFLIVLLKVYTFKNCSGLSMNTLICYLLIFIGRLTSTLSHSAYLPSDSSGDWFYQFTEIASFLLILFIIFLMKKTYKETTTLNENLLTDTFWTFAMYLQTFAIYPQINLFVNKKGQIESYTSHYVALCGLSTLFSLIFWFDTYDELNCMFDVKFPFLAEYAGYIVIIAQILQLIIMGDFYYLYFKSLYKGEEINI